VFHWIVTLLPALTSNNLSVPSSPPTLQAISRLEAFVTGPSFGILRLTRVGTGFNHLCESKQVLIGVISDARN